MQSDSQTSEWYSYFENDVLGTLSAVSYTHLDVYKRQVLTESGRVPALNVPDKKILTTVTM